MRRLKWLNVTLVITMLLTFLSPISSVKVIASTTYGLQEPVQVGNEVLLTWTYESLDTEPFERFEIKRNEETFEIQPEIIEDHSDEESFNITYSYSDLNIEPETTYTYEVIGWRGDQPITIGTKQITTTALENNEEETSITEENQEEPASTEYEGAMVYDITEYEIGLAWYEYTENENVVYEVYINGSLYKQYQQNEVQDYLVGLEPATEYEILFKVVDEQGVELYSQTLFAKTTNDIVESEELWIYENVVTESTASFYWEYSGNGIPKEYAVYLEGTLVNTVTNNTIEFTDLQSSTTYEVTIEALNENGDILISSSYYVTTLSEPSGEVIEFADVNLENAIKEQLGVSRDIVKSDMDDLFYLDISNAGIQDLSGLENATNLGSLNLQGNNISNIDALQNLHELFDLNLADNPIESFTPLSGLTNLFYLDLTNTGLQDGSVLENLTNLQYLSIDDNPISNISFIQNLRNIYTLYMSNTQIQDISVLQSLPNLMYLYIYGQYSNNIYNQLDLLYENGIFIFNNVDESLYTYYLDERETTIEISWYYDGAESPVTYNIYLNGELHDELSNVDSYLFTNLQMDTLYDIKIKAYDELGNLVGVDYISAHTLPKPDGEVVIFKDTNLEQAIKNQLGITRDIYTSDLERLTRLHLEGNEINDLSGIQYAVNLEGLYLSDNNITSLEPIKSLTNLQNLKIDNNPINDFSILSSLVNLKYISAINTGFTDINLLTNLTNLESLVLDENNIQGSIEIPNFPYLDNLRLGNNAITNISLLGELPELSILILSGNPISDLSFLTQLNQLNYIELNETEVNDITPLLDLENLTAVWLNNLPNIDYSEGSSDMEVIKQLEAF